MYFRDLVFHALLISIVRFSTSAVIQPQRILIVQLSPKPVKGLEDIGLDRWKMVHPEFKAPRVEIHLLKGQVSSDEKWAFSNEYKYSAKDYDAPIKMTSTTDEKKIPQTGNGNVKARENEKGNRDGAQDNIVMPDRVIPQIGSRNIITAPTYCPKGQRKDSKGRCRTIIM